MRTLVLGIGNEILGDDAVGIHIAHRVIRQAGTRDITVKETTSTGLELLELIRGYDRLIVVDAVIAAGPVPGKIRRRELADIPNTGNSITPHEGSLSAVIELGKALFPGEMPIKLVVYTVETGDVEHVTDEMSSDVRKAVFITAGLILDECDSPVISNP